MYEDGSDIDDLAARAGADRDALGRLLRYLVSRGVLTGGRERTIDDYGALAAAAGLRVAADNQHNKINSHRLLINLCPTTRSTRFLNGTPPET